MYFLFCFWWLSAWGGCDELNTNSRSIFYHNDNHIFAEPREYRYCLSLVFNIVLVFFFGMGGKMTKSFYEWINENGFNFRPDQYDLYKYLYEAGQQSKQAKVDELQERVKELELINFDSELHLDAAKEHIGEMQKQIDLALEKCHTGIRKQGGDYYLELVQGVLKGDQS